MTRPEYGWLARLVVVRLVVSVETGFAKKGLPAGLIVAPCVAMLV